MSDRISLTIPRQRAFHGVAHLVLGGLALRRNLTLEQLEDLQLALDALLEHDQRDGDVTVELEVREDALVAAMGPFDAARLRGELERGDPSDGAVGLSRVLATVVDDLDLEDRGGGTWVRLVKAMQIPAEA